MLCSNCASYKGLQNLRQKDKQVAVSRKKQAAGRRDKQVTGNSREGSGNEDRRAHLPGVGLQAKGKRLHQRLGTTKYQSQ